MIRTLALMMAAAASLSAAGRLLELRGTVTGTEAPESLRVQLFSVERPYTAAVPVDDEGSFRFRKLAPGNYTLAVVRSGLGEIRRTVVISPAQADDDGVVRTEIDYSPAEAARSNSTGMVSLAALAIPEKAHDKYVEAQSRLAKRDPEGAVRRLREAVAIAPDFAAAWNALGVIAFQQGDAETADLAFRRALEAEPGAFEATVNLGGLLLRSGHPQEALVYNQRAAEQRPADAQANAQLGMNYFQLGKFDQAAGYLEAAERADPALQSQPQLFLAEIYRRRGDRTGAVRELEDLLARHPEAANAAAVRDALAKLRD